VTGSHLNHRLFDEVTTRTHHRLYDHRPHALTGDRRARPEHPTTALDNKEVVDMSGYERGPGRCSGASFGAVR